jgi:hypothetical protein
VPFEFELSDGVRPCAAGSTVSKVERREQPPLIVDYKVSSTTRLGRAE